MPLSAAPLWTESLEASASPTTSSAATWANEAVTAALALLQTPVTLPEEPGAEMEENDSPSTLETADDRENDETVAAVRGVSTVVPSQLAPRKDIRGGAVVDWVVGG